MAITGSFEEKISGELICNLRLLYKIVKKLLRLSTVNHFKDKVKPSLSPISEY